MLTFEPYYEIQNSQVCLSKLAYKQGWMDFQSNSWPSKDIVLALLLIQNYLHHPNSFGEGIAITIYLVFLSPNP